MKKQYLILVAAFLGGVLIAYLFCSRKSTVVCSTTLIDRPLDSSIINDVLDEEPPPEIIITAPVESSPVKEVEPAPVESSPVKEVEVSPEPASA